MSSKEEAKSEAYKQLWQETRAELEIARSGIEAAEKRASEAEAVSYRLDDKARSEEARAAAHREAAQESALETEGARADLLATTRRMVLAEALLEDAHSRLARLHDALTRIASWPVVHSSEAKDMRGAARDAIAADRRSMVPCDCGVSKGLRADHESRCAATYLRPRRG